MTDTAFATGDVIEGRYRVLRVVGSGGMGTLYQVADEAREGEIAALKTVRLHSPLVGEAEAKARLQREFQILTQLRHPNLVDVYNYGIAAEGELYFTMEWIEGNHLGTILGSVSLDEAVPLVVGVCRALAYLHARGVIHGDLKPHNVMMTRQRVRLVDFGVALEARSTQARSHYYTPRYSAPEIVERRPVDHRLDLYSLGATWYALLLGEPPDFLQGRGMERLILFTLIEKLGEEADALGGVIARLLVTSPRDRYASANEVIAAINQATGSGYALETEETARSYALRTRFVDRQAEMEELRAAWAGAREGRGRLALIRGEAGVGKTRLLEELKVQVELAGGRVVVGQCVEDDSSAYRPWREVLRILLYYVEGADGAGLDLERVGPVLATILPEMWDRAYMADLDPPAELDPQSAQQRLNQAIGRVLGAAAKMRPTLVVIENAHGADEATLALLPYLARVVEQHGLLICVTYRSEETDASHSLETLAGDALRRIEIGRLSPDVTADLARSMLGLADLPSLLAQRLQQITGGNALFVQELIRSLAVEEEVLRRTTSGWQVDDEALRAARLPESIRQVVWRRLRQVPEEARQVLRWAAVVGTIFWEEALAHVGQVARPRVRAGLRQAIEQELVVEREETSFAGEWEYLFTNPTVREVSYETIPFEERGPYHGRVAAWLMGRAEAEVEEHLGLIAEHLEGAGQVAQAVDYFLRAGEQAAARFAHAEAIGYLSRALALTPEEDHERRYDLLLAREKVYYWQGQHEAQAADLATLASLALVLGPTQQATVGLRQALYAHATGDYAQAISSAQAAIGHAQSAGDRALAAAGHYWWGGALFRQGEYSAAGEQVSQALALAQEAGDQAVAADSHKALGLVALDQGEMERAQEHLRHALGICREIGERRGEGVALNTLGQVLGEQGDYAGARAYFEQALDIYRQIGYRRSEGASLNNLGEVCRRVGDYAGARKYYEQALEIAREVGSLYSQSVALSNLGLVLHNLGDDEGARSHARQALQIAQEIGERRQQGFALTILGHARAALGDEAGAIDAYRKSLAIRRDLGTVALSVEPLAGLAEVALARDEGAQALAHVEEILAHLEAGGNVEGADEPFRVYLACYQALAANRDPRAPEILAEAHSLLQERAARILDESTRRAFLEDVSYHREIAALGSLP